MGAVKLGPLDAIPPAVRHRIADALALASSNTTAFDGVPLERLVRLIEDGEPWLGAEPSLAEVGYWMIDPRHAVELRRRGCVWLTMFPSAETAKRLAAIALDEAQPMPVRDQAIWALGQRQLRAMHPGTQWPVDAIQFADEALVKLADVATAAGKIASEQLPFALRHVQWEGAGAVFARAPVLWGEAIECFATPALARVLLVCLDDMAPQHRLRASRLVGAVLGEEAVPMLLVRAARGTLEEKLEALFIAVAVSGDKHLALLDETVREMRFADLLRARAKWHLANRGVIPTVRGLRIARTTAVIPPAERAAKIAQAADDLGVLAKFVRHPEPYVYKLWAWMVHGAGDPARAYALVAAHPESQQVVRDLYLADLATRGRVAQLSAAAQGLGAADIGAMQLAIWGRPLAALELAATARLHTPELVVARALACFRAGRPDLAERLLAEDLPPAEVVDDRALPAFPGPHERWLVERAPAARAAVAALVRGKAGVLELARPAAADAEPEPPSLEGLAAVARRLDHELKGSTVYLAGEFKYADKNKIARAVEAAGARLVGGPFPGTDYYVAGDPCQPRMIAQLERQGARQLRAEQLT